MSGHSKWHSIKHKKGAADAARGKVFTRHANLITIAARQGGGDPDMNPALRLAIDNAKKENVPNANIERAIKRGSGESKDAAEIFELTYEGYGPGGTAVIVECLTDNKNRTLTNVRTIFNKRGGNLGESGSVAWMFERKGVITMNTEEKDPDEIELAAIDAGAADTEREDGIMQIYTTPNELTTVADSLKNAGFEADQAEVLLVPNQTVNIEDENTAKKILDFIDAIEEDPDVSNVSGNFDISDELMEKI
ncbi:YebC/PmpR family DNA-binding transcriptional regulator [Patescibacteria group bacterium]|nr:YebC/PmpR family DNA-binding transcriptional regulator [Patescibacteria group bacterium]MBU1682727.1 YebC/PmpR family DNA-binding transcriptional regulator [Patescibacteria group bacterium]MBU1934887.1 YebC/PmpR family DNA-binding transcriptional regulator [Patescibacteria group bacterium]